MTISAFMLKVFTGSDAMVLLQIMGVGLVGWLSVTVLSALGQGTISLYIKVATVFASFLLVANIIWKAVVAVFKMAGFTV